MKRNNIIKSLLTAMLLVLSIFGFKNNKSINAVATELNAGTKISTNITATLNEDEVKIEFTTPVNLDGNNNALLIGLASQDGTILSDERFVVSSTNTGIYDEDDTAIIYQNLPATIGTKTQVNASYKYEIRTTDFTIKNGTKNIDKLVIIGQKGTLISTQVSFTKMIEGYEDAKVITVSDLIDSNSNQIGGITSIPGVKNLSSNMNLTYNNNDHKDYYSLVFKFKYKVFELGQNQFHLTNYDNRWNSASSFILNSDNGTKVNFGNSDAESSHIDFTNIPYSLNVGNTYDIEYGRVAKMYGDTFLGVYHVYLKINNQIIREKEMGIPQVVLEGNTAFITSSGKNLIYDYNYSFEQPKEISIRDIKKSGNLVGYTLNLQGDTDLTYRNTDHTANYSIVFKFRYEVNENKNSQIHLSCPGTDPVADGSYKWQGASSFILNNDGNVNLGKSTAESSKNGWFDISYPMSIGSTYDVEFGRLAIMNGNTFANKYLVYLVIDGALIRASEFAMPRPVVEGNLIFITSTKSNNIYDKDYYPEYQTAINNIDSFMKIGFSFDVNNGIYSDVKCALGVGVDKGIANNLVNVPYTYGLEVSTSTKTVYYSSDSDDLINGDVYYSLIKLGDIINNSERSVDLFTIRAYIEVNGIKYLSSSTKSHSVKSLINYYIELNDNGTISLDENQINALTSLQTALA